MSNARAHPISLNPEQVVWEKISRFNWIHEQRIDGMISLQDLGSVPTFREIRQSKAFDKVRRQNPDAIDVYELKEKDIDLQNYILGRYLDEIKDCKSDGQRSREYIHVINVFDRYGINASDYLTRIEDRDARLEACELIKAGAASYVKVRLSNQFERVVLAAEDMSIIESESSSPNAKLESLLRPFQDAVTYNHKKNMYIKPEWFDLLGLLQQAGFDYEDRGLTEAIKPDNAYTNTLMAFEYSNAEPA